MKICRYQLEAAGSVLLGIVEDGQVFNVSSAAGLLPALRWPFPPGDQLIANLAMLRPEMERLKSLAKPVPVGQVLLKSPVANPGKFLCGAGNFKEVLERGGHPRKLGLLFKMTSAAAGPSDGVMLRWPERTTFYETEIAIIIGKTGTEIPASEALDHVAGYTIGLDMTMQGSEFPSFGKSFDSYGVIGPWMVTADELTDTSNLAFSLTINGEVRQADNLANLILDVPHLIEHASSIMTLHPGDVIFSGTPPSSVGPVLPGDIMVAQMDGIGEMTVTVRGGPGKQPYTD